VWSTWEPRDGEFDLDWLQPVLDAAHERGIKAIVGTPTYAAPPWLRRRYPETAAHPATGPAVPAKGPGVLKGGDDLVRLILGERAIVDQRLEGVGDALAGIRTILGGRRGGVGGRRRVRARRGAVRRGRRAAVVADGHDRGRGRADAAGHADDDGGRAAGGQPHPDAEECE